MKARLLFALLAVVLTTTACGDSIVGPVPARMNEVTPPSLTTTTDTVRIDGDGPFQGSGTRP